MTDFALDLKGVSKSFGTTRALEGVDLRVGRGETHVLLGLSGSGKSTLIRILVGLSEADAGEIHVASGGVGYVPQEGGLFPHLSAAKNITLVGELRGWTRADLRRRLTQLAEQMKLEPSLLRRFPKELSGGQRQRVALMRAAFLRPALLVLDEPLGALDPLVRLSVQDELKGIIRELGTSVVMVTHDIDEARFFGDRLTILRGGRVEQSGPYSELESHPASDFVAKFLHARRDWENAQ